MNDISVESISLLDLLKAFEQAPSGLQLAECLKLCPTISRRTLQRWIRQLVDESKITTEGQGPARRYFLAQPIKTEKTELNLNKDSAQDLSQNLHKYPDYIPLSSDGRDILNYLSLPLSARKSVGYQREFLDAYEPNQTEYLPEPLRRQLRNMGDTGQGALAAGTYGRGILNRLLIDLSWASSHLEGNTYTRLDTQELIEHHKVAEGRATLETQMILNHKSAIELLIENADSVGFNRYTLMNVHSALSENLLPNAFDEGRIREHVVEIGQSQFKPISTSLKINELLDIVLLKANQIKDPFEQSFFIMVHLPYLQPFADVNKRTSRLMANLPLIRANLCPMTFLDVPEPAYSRAVLGVYELNRVELLRDLYLWAYERSTQEYLVVKKEMVEPDPVRLAYRSEIREVIYQIVTHPNQEAYLLIQQWLKENSAKILPKDLKNVEALLVDELRRLHEGVLARYGLKLSEFEIWKKIQRG